MTIITLGAYKPKDFPLRITLDKAEKAHFETEANPISECKVF